MSASRSSSSSSSLESLEELGLIIDTIPDEKKYQEHANPFETYDEVEFKLRFRFSKQAVQNFLQLIDTKLEPIQNKRGLPVSKMNQLLVALRFYATGREEQTEPPNSEPERNVSISLPISVQQPQPFPPQIPTHTLPAAHIPSLPSTSTSRPNFHVNRANLPFYIQRFLDSSSS
ncbi:hypothetical protein CBL_02944 [Carabus blaptoides fortunei]